MSGELLVIMLLGLGLAVALVLLFVRKPSSSLDAGSTKSLDWLVAMIQKIQSEQRVDQEAQKEIKNELRFNADKLRELVTETQERHKRDEEAFKNILLATKGIESVMRGSKTKGMAGENIIREILKLFPQGTMVYDFKIGSKVVEFGLKLPDGRILPVDSKMMAAEELALISKTEDEPTKLRLIQKIELLVLRQAREVGEYISPPVTYERAIMAVPDSIHYLL
ncbi:MAG: DNA recombination protein RmuC, partial [bacterium]